ncbi:LacI family DNA-binding transcriptional regulator [Mesorhizobium sp. BR1-1-16]|uniref:LacI family DNA-binding transcriptional regulator n=1 Tax=Mesorhizobium sp. BR1-1-16 TaxID=2876653 RepID=UPI001CC96FF2|nr:LacI family DNA-binding transcriptional regulator [Mesorhizobium sp. BR1-1-16]MBZ9937227.1 LacI family DNA-binding transcriptional regulator [Mesorhizobium sp. BR1-1-16]
MAKRISTGRPTIADVAARAGVGAITVSRFLRQPEKVSEALGASIAAAVRELNYVPDLNARALASRRTDIVVVLVPSLTQNIFSDVLRGIYDGVEDSGLRIELNNTRYSSAIEEQQVHAALRHGPAAIIISGTEQTPATRTMLANAGCPVIQIMDLCDDPIQKVIGFSHFRAGLDMTQHLIDSGYRRVAFFSGWMNARSKQRLLGYRTALENANLFDPDLIGQMGNENPHASRGSIKDFHQFSTAVMGRELMLDMLDRRPDVEAVFCNNDVLSIGALFALHSRNVPVPERIGIAGFNDFDYMEAAYPALSSVRIHRWKCGNEAMMAVRHQLDGGDVGPPVVDLGFEIMRRASTDRHGTLQAARQPEAALSLS